MTSRSRTRLLVAAALAAVAVGVGWRRWSHHAGETRSASGAGHSAPLGRAMAVAAPLPPGTVDPWRVGARRIYAADFSSRMETNKDDPSGWFSLAGSASLALTVVKADAARVVLRGALSEVSLALENDEHGGRHIEETFDSQLRPPFEVTIARSGRVESLAADPGTTGIAHGLLRVLVAALQFVRPDQPQADARQWTVEEPDQNGLCRVRYRQTGPGTFEKTKLEYTALEIAERLQLGKTKIQPTVSGAATVALRGAAGEGAPTGGELVADVEGRERLHLPVGASGFAVETHVALHWRSIDLPDELPALAGSLVAGSLDHTRESRPDAATALEARRRLVGGKSLDQLLGEVKGLPAAKQEERLELMRKLTALFDSDPASLAAAVAALRRAPAGPDRDLLLGALASAESPAAQRGIADLAGSAEAGTELRSQALTHLALDQHPSGETIHTLQRLAGDPNDPVREPAVLALGGAVRPASASPQTAPAADQALEQLTQGLHEAKTADDRRLFLGALGNGGSARSLDDIKASLADPDPVVRAAAADALRFISSDDVDPLLANAMLHDEAASVRAAAVRAAQYRQLSPTLEAAAEGLLKVEGRESIRLNLVAWLAEYLRAAPGPLAALQQTAQSDPSEQVRQAAAKALDTAAKTSG